MNMFFQNKPFNIFIDFDVWREFYIFLYYKFFGWYFFGFSIQGCLFTISITAIFSTLYYKWGYEWIWFFDQIRSVL